MARFWVGVSGFSYSSWRGKFYQEDTKAEDMLEAYSAKLNSVEINSTFYNMPIQKTTQKWNDSCPDDFRFSFKANRRITHIKKLRDTEQDTSFFMNALKPLDAKLGCVLVQLPPYQRNDATLLESFLKEVDVPKRLAFEFRHESWFTREIYGLLSKHSAALCVADTPEMKPVFQRTTSFAYVRLRQDHYSSDDLEDWAKKLEKFVSDNLDCFVYFKHDETGEAATKAMEFSKLL